MSDEYGVHHVSRAESTGWFVGGIVAMALLAIGGIVFAANRSTDDGLEPDQVRCMIANPGFECVSGWVKANPLPTGERDE